LGSGLFNSEGPKCTVFRRPPLKRPLVALNRLTTDRLFEGRFATLDFDAIKIGDRRLPSFPPQLVQNAIEHRLTQVRLQRTDTARLEVLDPLERLGQSVLDKIIRVGEIARARRPPAAGPSLERLEVSATRRSCASWSPARACSSR
jgi:hypothetical protein